MKKWLLDLSWDLQWAGKKFTTLSDPLCHSKVLLLARVIPRPVSNIVSRDGYRAVLILEETAPSTRCSVHTSLDLLP